MPNLEPTYLRFVYDSLNKGLLNAENAAALPRGFIGLYEQEFNQKTPVDKRKKVLNQLQKNLKNKILFSCKNLQSFGLNKF